MDLNLDKILSCWGKTEKGSQDPSVFHPVLFHILDVAHVAQCLLDGNCSPRWRNVLSDIYQIDPLQLQSFIPFFVALHDIGKFSASFQRLDPIQYQRLKIEGFPFGHSQDLSHAQVSRHFIWYEWPAIQKMSISDLNRKVLREMVAGHHGNFMYSGDLADIKLRLRIEEPQIWKDIRLSAFQKLSDLFFDPLLENIPEPGNISAAVMELTGFTTLCDWIGSDQRFFIPHPRLSLEEYLPISRDCALHAVERDGFSISTISDVSTTFTGLFSTIFEPRPLQLAIDDIPDSVLKEPSLIVIEAPTGEGKTEAALTLAHRIAALRETDEFYYALPTTATSNQMHHRVQQFLRDQLKLGIGAKLVHGQAFLTKDIIPVNPLNDVEDRSEEMASVDWFNSKKRALLAPFGVGTIDQIELGALNVRHSSLRLAGLSGKVIILDEVHAYDTYMTTIVVRLLTWLKLLGVSVILLSATLPAKRRAELLRTYHPQEDFCVDYPEYPIILAANSQTIFQLTPPASQASREVKVKFLHFLEGEADEKAQWLLDRVKDGGCVCWITNTVNRAQEIYKKILEMASDNIETVLFHARFPLDKRGDIEERINKLVGKDKSTRPKASIIIGTQVLEQSLDIDFDLIVSDLAPVDLLLQRAGRLHRHANTERPEALSAPELYINSPLKDEKPLIEIDKSVYAEYFLLRTYQVIKDKEALHLPGDYRRLIEQVYGEGVSDKSEDLKEALSKLQKEEELARQEAVFRLIPEPHPEEIFTATASRMRFSESETTAGWTIAQTRLGERSLNLIPLEDLGDFCKLRGSNKPLNKHLPADRVDQISMLHNQVRVTHKEIVNALSDQIGTLPELFKASALLRDYLPLWLKDGSAEIIASKSVYILTLDDQLGLTITKKGG